MSYSYKKLTPLHIHMLRLHWMGESNRAIADKLAVSEITVGNVINSEAGKEVIAGLQAATLDTIEQVQAEASTRLAVDSRQLDQTGD